MRTALCFLVLAALSVTAMAQVPRIEASEEAWDFGVREQGEKETKRIKISNVGKAKLEISEVKVTCGCVKGDVEKKSLAPGESTDLVLRLDTSRQSGLIRKFAYIKCNDPTRSNLIIGINGKINGNWSLESHSVNFGRIKAGKEYEKEFKIHVKKGYDMKLLAIEENSSHVTIETEPYGEIGDKHGWTLKIKILANSPPGPLAVPVMVKVQDKVRGGRVSIHARVEGDYVVSPARLYFGRVIFGKKKTLKITVRPKDAAGQIKVKKVVPRGEHLSVHMLEVKEGKQYDVLAVLEGKEGAGDLRGHLEIHTDVPGQEIVTVDYFGRAMPAPKPR